jgi:hypothetical protein
LSTSFGVSHDQLRELVRQLERRRVEDGELRILSRKVGEKDQSIHRRLWSGV